MLDCGPFKSFLFSRVNATLLVTVSVRPSIGPSVRRTIVGEHGQMRKKYQMVKNQLSPIRFFLFLLNKYECEG